jgi:hypothetical protein
MLIEKTNQNPPRYTAGKIELGSSAIELMKLPNSKTGFPFKKLNF